MERIEKKILQIQSFDDLENISKNLRVSLVLGVIERAIERSGLTWKDFLAELKSSDCPICKSRIRVCLNCSESVSVGTKVCLSCGTSTEKIELEPSIR